METPDMKNKPETITFGLGSEYFDLHIAFCKELAILLGIVETLRSSVPAILPGWAVKTKHVNLLGNNLPIMWVYENFIETTIIGSAGDQILKIVPIVNDTKSIAHSVFHIQDFVAVQKRRIQSFEIWIKVGPGNSDVLPIDDEIILVLYFQPSHRR